MNIDWKTGKPDYDGDFIVIHKGGYVSHIGYTVKYGWNSYPMSWEYAFPDEEIVLWTEPFGQKAIDIYVLP